MTKQLSLAILAITLECLCSRTGTADDHAFSFEVSTAGRTSVGVFEPTSGRLVRTLWSGERVRVGRHSIAWDGLDHRGEPVPASKYQWRVITAPGFKARYVMTIGINPPGGEHPEPRRSWVGDHIGGGIVDVDPSGVYVGSPMTEGLMMLAKVDAASSTDVDPHGHRHEIEIEYINPDSRAELKLLWKSLAIDPQRIPTERLFVR